MPWPFGGLLLFLTLGWGWTEFTRYEEVNGDEILKLCQTNLKIARVANRSFPGVIENDDSWKFYEPRFDKPKILVSIPNGVETFHPTNKDAQERRHQFLIAEIGEWLNDRLGIPLIRLLWASDDPNLYDDIPEGTKTPGFVAGKPLPYKAKLKNIFETYPSIEAVIDLQAASFESSADADIGTGSTRQTLKSSKGSSAVNVIKKAWEKHRLLARTDNKLDGGGCCEQKTVTRFASQAPFNKDAFRLLVNNESFTACLKGNRDKEHRDPFQKVLYAIEDMIFDLTTHYEGCIEGFTNTGTKCEKCTKVPHCEDHKKRCFDGTSVLRCHTCKTHYKLDDVTNQCEQDTSASIEEKDKKPIIGEKHHPSPQMNKSYSPLHKGPTEVSKGRAAIARSARGARSVDDGDDRLMELLQILRSYRSERSGRSTHDSEPVPEVHPEVHDSRPRHDNPFYESFEPKRPSYRSVDASSSRAADGDFPRGDDQEFSRSGRSVNPFSPFYRKGRGVDDEPEEPAPHHGRSHNPHFQP